MECSPGIMRLQDDSIAARYPDLPFTPAALMLTPAWSASPSRAALSRPGLQVVASDPVGAAARLLEIDDSNCSATARTSGCRDDPGSVNFPIGTPLFALPDSHRPSVAFHRRRAAVIVDGEINGYREVTARDRMLGV